MMYKIIDSPNPKWKAAVLSKTGESLSESLADIASHLAKRGLSGKILLDYITYNGDSANRFFEISFNGKNFEYETFAKSSVDDATRDKIDGFYKKNRSLFPTLSIVAPFFEI